MLSPLIIGFVSSCNLGLEHPVLVTKQRRLLGERLLVNEQLCLRAEAPAATFCYGTQASFHLFPLIEVTKLSLWECKLSLPSKYICQS